MAGKLELIEIGNKLHAVKPILRILPLTLCGRKTNKMHHCDYQGCIDKFFSGGTLKIPTLQQHEEMALGTEISRLNHP